MQVFDIHQLNLAHQTMLDQKMQNQFLVFHLQKELKYFEKKLIKAGASETFVFEVDPARDLGYLDGAGRYFVEAGEYHIFVGDRDIKLQL